MEKKNFGGNFRKIYIFTLWTNKSKPIKLAYEKLIEDPSNILKYAQRWLLSDIFQNFDFKKYEVAFDKYFSITKNSKLRDFQYRMLIEKLVFNKDLYAWHKEESDKCDFCKIEVEDIKHCFFLCAKIQPILQFVKTITNQYEIVFEKIFYCNIHEKANHIFNYILLVMKQYIYRNRCLKIESTVNNFKRELKQLHNIEYYNAKQKDVKKVELHNNRWNPIYNYIYDNAAQQLNPMTE